MEYFCSECSIELSKDEIKLNVEFPIGKFTCFFCDDQKERQLIKMFSEQERKVSNNEFY